jgi:hypothetical protein
MTSARDATVHREFVMGTSNFAVISFPDDFMFQLTREEAVRGCQACAGRGRHPKYRSYAFAEQGVSLYASSIWI